MGKTQSLVTCTKLGYSVLGVSRWHHDSVQKAGGQGRRSVESTLL